MKTIEKIAEEYAERLYPMDMIGGGITKSNRQLQQNACKKAFIEGYNMDRWISVEQDLPPTGFENKVLVFCKREYEKQEEVILAWREEYGFCSLSMREDENLYVSHWQPCPSSPKTVNNDTRTTRAVKDCG